MDDVADWSDLPKPIPVAGGALLPHMSARQRTATIDALFEGCGGFERAKAWIESSDENYGKFFMQVWAKGAEKAVSVEHDVSDTFEAALAKLDQSPAPIDHGAVDAEWSESDG